MVQNKADIIKLAVDLTRGNALDGNFSAQQGSEVLRKALIEANGGSEKIDYKSLRRNKTQIFEIIEEIIPVITREGLEGDEFFMNMVEEKNLAEGDKNEFWVDDNSEFLVSKIASGINTVRRQRIGAKTPVALDTNWFAVTIYEEFSLFVAGRRDWNAFVDKVAKAFKNKLLAMIYTTFTGINASTVGLSGTYVKTGVYDEETLLGIVEHVEAATGKNAIIVGTKAALRKCTTASASAEVAKTDLYNIGYYGKLASVPMVGIKNKHAVGTENFIFADDVVYVLASDDKPIKVVREGEGYITDEDGSANADMPLMYTYKEKFGVGLIVNGKLGKYTISNQ